MDQASASAFPASQLHELETMLRLAMRGARMGMWVRNFSDESVQWSPELETLFGLEAGSFAGSRDAFRKLVHEEDLRKLAEAVEIAVSTHRDYVVEFRFQHASGEWRWMDGRGKAIYDPEGKPLRLYGVGIDITERKHAEQALEEEARALATVNRVGASVAAELDLERVVQIVTDAATELSGADFGSFFYNVRDDNGESYWLYSLSGASREDFAGFPMPRNTAVFAPTFAGEGAVRSDDITRDPRYGHNPPHKGMPKGHLPVRSYLAVPVVSRSGEVIGGLFFGHRDVGVFTERAEYLITGIASQAAIAIDNARAYQAAQKEIAARAQVEAALRDSETQLRAAGAERERLLQSERAARTDAERLGTLKDEFLATLSHELRTPLNAIVGWTTLMRRPNVAAEDLSRGLETIDRNARMQGQIISDLLDMSAILSGKINLDVKPLNLHELISMAVEGVRPSAQAKNIRVQTVLDAKVGLTRGDQNRLQQVLWNLLTNAIKFTAPGGRVHVVLERVNSHVEISIEDNGLGIGADFLPYVFDRFRQADASTTRRHGGLGLGLSIVKNLIELHGGSVRAKSPGENQGSTFIVALPMSAMRTQEGAHPHPLSGSAQQLDDIELPKLNGITVLVVDDEYDARSLIGRLLEERGAKCILAGGAQQALEVIEQQTIDLLLSDIGMPDRDGYDLIQAVRALEGNRNRRVPAVALTAYARAEDRQRCLLAGYQMHTAKPVEALELIAGVASLVDVSGRQKH